MKLKDFLFSLLILAVASVVYAGTITGTWTNALKNTDGTNIATPGQPGALVSSTFEYSLCGPDDTFGVKLGEQVNTTQLTPGAVAASPTIPNIGPGRYCARVVHKNSFGSLSDYSDIGVKVIDAPVPGKPSKPNF